MAVVERPAEGPAAPAPAPAAGTVPSPTPPPVAEGAGLLLIEHLNLNVLSTEAAMTFYEALGCRRDASRPLDKTLHTNCGPLTQFHLPSPANEAYIQDAGAQVWRGEIELLYEDATSLQQAGHNVRALLGEALFAGSLLHVEALEGGDLRVTGPYGNRFLLRVASDERRAALAPRSGQRKGSEGCQVVALGSVTLAVPPGAAERGARFYQEVLGFATRQLGPGRWALLGGPGPGSQQLVLEDTEGATGKEVGEHMAIYIGDFAGCFERLDALGLIFVNPRFKHLDRSTTVEQAWKFNCFRFKDVVDVASGEKLFELEHEVRSTGHKSCPPALRP